MTVPAPRDGLGDPGLADPSGLADPLGLALRATLLVAILDASLFWFQRWPVMVVAGVGLIVPSLARRQALWWILFALVAWPLVWNWPFSDNHAYLRAAWALAVALALGAHTPRLTLATSARLLLGILFFYATLWKAVLSPDFVDGTFFRVTLLTDGRFHDLALLAGGIAWEHIEAFDAVVTAAQAGKPLPAFDEPAALGLLAKALTVFTLLAEGALALAFLWPPRGPVHRWRNVLLLLFAAATYSFATVRGFGWLLMVIGIAQTDPDERRTRIAFLAMIFVIEAYRVVPWSQALLEALGRV